MKLIERYIFSRVFVLSVATLVVTTTIALTTQVLLRVDLLSSTGQSLLTFLELAGLLVPSMFIIVAPFALMIGAAQTLTTMNADSELAVMEASGASPGLTARPILSIAVLFSIATLLMNLYAEPWANRHLRDLLHRASADLFSAAVQSGSFHKIEDGLYVNIAEKLPGGRLGGIFLSDQRDQSIELIYYAKHGEFAESDGRDILVLSDGELHRKNTANDQVSVIRFTTYGLDLSQIGGSDDGRSERFYAKESPVGPLLSLGPDDPLYQEHESAVRKEIAKRFSLWLYPFLFGLITVYFLGRAHSNRHEQVWSVVTAAGIAFAIRGFSFYSVDQAGTSRAMEIASFAAPIGGCVLFALLLLTNWTFRAPRWLIDQSDRLLSGTETASAAMRNWLTGRTDVGNRGAR